jgi:hypothetical protein
MQTTLVIDDDVLADAERLAEERHQTVGEVISSLSRQSLKHAPFAPVSRSGFPLLPVRDTTPITLEFINQLRDEYP